MKGTCLCGAVEVVANDAAQIGLCHCSMCRRWTGGHHLIDPRTGTPAATRWHSVSVVAATATDANAAAPAAVILGDDGPAWLADTGLDGRFVAPDRVACVGRWTHEEDVA